MQSHMLSAYLRRHFFLSSFPKGYTVVGSAGLHILKSCSNAIAMNKDLDHKKVQIWLSPPSEANLVKACLLFITVIILDWLLMVEKQGSCAPVEVVKSAPMWCRDLSVKGTSPAHHPIQCLHFKGKERSGTAYSLVQ